MPFVPPHLSILWVDWNINPLKGTQPSRIGLGRSRHLALRRRCSVFSYLKQDIRPRQTRVRRRISFANGALLGQRAVEPVCRNCREAALGGDHVGTVLQNTVSLLCLFAKGTYSYVVGTGMEI